MSSRSAGAFASAIVAVAGAGLLLSSFMGVRSLELRILGADWQWLQAGFGGALLLTGCLVLFAVLNPPPPKPAITPAHVAFTRRVRREIEPPAPVALAQGARARESASDPELERVLKALREVDLKIKQASVMLGMGKLTREGYASYVSDLRMEKGQLESEKLKLEAARARGMR